MELESSATSAPYISSRQITCFSLARGSKNVTEILYSSRLGHLIFPLSQLFTAEWPLLGTFSPRAIQRAQTLCRVQRGRRGHDVFTWNRLKKQLPVLCQTAGTQNRTSTPQVNFWERQQGGWKCVSLKMGGYKQIQMTVDIQATRTHLISQVLPIPCHDGRAEW